MLNTVILIFMFAGAAYLLHWLRPQLADTINPEGWIAGLLQSLEWASWLGLAWAVIAGLSGHASSNALDDWLSGTIAFFIVVGMFKWLLGGLGLFGFGKKKTGAVRDVKQDAESMKKLAETFDPLPYINLQKGIFAGLDDKRRPVYWPQNLIDGNHMDVVGASGTGKSSFVGVLLSQLAAAGETVLIFDPKADRNLPGVLAEAGRSWGEFPVHVLDLRPVADFPQVNPFKDCRADQVEELLQVALELGKTGDAGVDFYRGKDREATGFIAESLSDGRTDMLEIIEKAAVDERITEQENLWRELRQLNRIKAFQTEAGLDLVDVLSRPGILYVIGSTTKLEVVAGQKLLLQRILQIVDERADQSRPVAMFLDELKYLLSPAALRAASTIRDRNCHLLFAHQSLGDLADCPGLDPIAVKGAIWGNTTLKVVYKVEDVATAKDLSAAAGESAVDSSSTSKRKGAMVKGTETTTTTTERAADFMPSHIFTHLPKPRKGTADASVGVVFGLGVASFLSTRWLVAGEAPQPVRAEPVLRVVESKPQQPEDDPFSFAENGSDTADDMADLLKD